MGITAAALPIVRVAVGGRSDLTAMLLGTILLIGGFQALAVYGSHYALLVMGLLLVVTVLLTPEELILALSRRRLRGHSRVRCAARQAHRHIRTRMAQPSALRGSDSALSSRAWRDRSARRSSRRGSLRGLRLRGLTDADHPGEEYDARGLESLPYDLGKYLERIGPYAAIKTFA